METTREWINPIEWLVSRGVVCEHIVFDPSVVPEYRIIRGAAHDGTAIFTEELMGDALLNLVHATSFYVPKGEPGNDVAISYRIGWIRRAVVYGQVDLKVGRFPGQCERLTIPVREKRTPK